VAQRGGSADFVAGGRVKADTVETLDVEQEALKADLKAALAELRTWRSEGREIVKLAYRDEKEKWVEFGI